MHNNTMHIIDRNSFIRAMKSRGFKTIQAFADFVGVHRNTVHHYLSGAPVVPAKLEQLLEALDIPLVKAVVKVSPGNPVGIEAIAPIVDKLHNIFPSVTFVLFGSRARGEHTKYADWDIGAFSKDGLSHPEYRTMRISLSDECESFPFQVDLVNLNRADESFLKPIAKDWIFLAGRQSDWLALKERAVNG